MGHKRFETRSWKRDGLIGERIAIHAAKRPPKDLPRVLLHELEELKLDPSDLPLGAVLGTAAVIDFHQTELIAPHLTRRELAFGDYAIGRWAWRLNDVERLPDSLPARGKQGIWNWTHPIE
jgi:hypothetical protein